MTVTSKLQRKEKRKKTLCENKTHNHISKDQREKSFGSFFSLFSFFSFPFPYPFPFLFPFPFPFFFPLVPGTKMADYLDEREASQVLRYLEEEEKTEEERRQEDLEAAEAELGIREESQEKLQDLLSTTTVSSRPPSPSPPPSDSPNFSQILPKLLATLSFATGRLVAHWGFLSLSLSLSLFFVKYLHQQNTLW